MTVATLTYRDRSVTEPSALLPVRRRLRRDTHAPEAARNFTGDTLAAHGITGDTADSALLAVSELVTNAVLYANRGHITVEIAVGEKQVRIAVTDADAVAAECGIDRIGGGNGNRAWFVLDAGAGIGGVL